MAVKKDYSKARAKKSKSTNINAPDIDISKSDAKRVANKVKKSPIMPVVSGIIKVLLLVIVILLYWTVLTKRCFQE